MQEIWTDTIVTPMTRSADESTERLGRLFDRHHQRLYRLARRLCPGSDEARDLVQETYLRAARRPASIPDGEGPEEAWLVSVLLNLSRDRQRRLRVRRQAAIERLLPATVPPDVEAAVVARATVQKALTRLSPKRRAVVVLHELEELPVIDVARRLGMARVTVRWHLSRARRELAEILLVPPADDSPPRARKEDGR